MKRILNVYCCILKKNKWIGIFNFLRSGRQSVIRKHLAAKKKILNQKYLTFFFLEYHVQAKDNIEH